jgi:hypothetical protein
LVNGPGLYTNGIAGRVSVKRAGSGDDNSKGGVYRTFDLVQ